MKKFATGTFLDMNGDHEVEPSDQIPFFGFVTGTLLSAALWVGIGLAFWAVRP